MCGFSQKGRDPIKLHESLLLANELAVFTCGFKKLKVERKKHHILVILLLNTCMFGKGRPGFGNIDMVMGITESLQPQNAGQRRGAFRH